MTKKRVQVTEGEVAPPLSAEELQAMQAPAKPKRQPKPAVKQVSLDDLPRLAESVCGWSPRITIYIADPDELSRMMKQRGFSAQNPNIPQHVIGQYHLREVGALHEEPDRRSGEVPSDKRIVEVTLAKG